MISDVQVFLVLKCGLKLVSSKKCASSIVHVTLACVVGHIERVQMSVKYKHKHQI